LLAAGSSRIAFLPFNSEICAFWVRLSDWGGIKEVSLIYKSPENIGSKAFLASLSAKKL
jgi:hypothetical protein